MKRVVNLILLCGVLLLSTGCIGVNSDFKRIRTKLISSVGVDFQKDIEFRIGSAGIKLVGMFVSFAETDEPIEEYLNDISYIQIGVYKTKRGYDYSPSLSSLKVFNEHLEGNNWQHIVRSVNRNQLTGIYIKYDDEERLNINSLFIASLDERELVLVEVGGDLEELVKEIIRNEQFHIVRK